MENVFFLGMIILLFFLGHVPFLFSPYVNLESWYAGAAEFINQGRIVEGANYLKTTIANPISSVFSLVPFYRLFGVSVFSARIFSLLCGILAILITYGISLRCFSKRHAIIAALLFAINPVFWLYSGLVGTDAPFLFFTSLAMYLMLLGLESNKLIAYLLSGLAFGIAFLFKLNLLTFIPIILLVLIAKYYSFIKSGNKEKILEMLKIFFVYLVSMGIIMAPYIFWSLKNLGYLISPEYCQHSGIGIKEFSNNFVQKFSHLWGYIGWIGVFSWPLLIFIYNDILKKYKAMNVLMFSGIVFVLCLYLSSFIYGCGDMQELQLGWIEHLFGNSWIFFIRAAFICIGTITIVGVLGIETKNKLTRMYLLCWFIFLILLQSLVKPSQRYLLYALPPLCLYFSSIVMLQFNHGILRTLKYFLLLCALVSYSSVCVFNSYYFSAEGKAAADLALFVNTNKLSGIEYSPAWGPGAHCTYLINKTSFVFDKKAIPKYRLVTLDKSAKMKNMIKAFDVKFQGIVFKRYAVIKNI